MRSIRKPVIIASLLIICFAVLICGMLMLQGSRGESASGEIAEDIRTARLFSVNDTFYCIRMNGQLEECNENISVPLFRFPSGAVCWSELLNGFVYYESGSIKCFGLNNYTDSLLYDIKSLSKGCKTCYIAAAFDKYIIFRCDTYNYCLDAESKTVIKAPSDVHNTVFAGNGYYVFCSSDHKLIYLYEAKTNDTVEIIRDELADDPIVSGFVSKDTLYYARSSGKLSQFSLSPLPDSIPGSPSLTDLGAKVVAVNAVDDDLICVLGVKNGSIRETEVVVLNSDGTAANIRSSSSLIYSVPGSCSLAVNGRKYAFIVSTCDIICFGELEH